MAFNHFVSLPWELRSYIWELAVSDIPPREIQIRSAPHDEHSQSPDELQLHQVSIPALLLACRDSHAIALQRYTHIFAHNGSSYATWVDLRRDIISTEELGAPTLLEHPDMQKAMQLKVSCSDATASDPTLRLRLLRQFNEMANLCYLEVIDEGTTVSCELPSTTDIEWHPKLKNTFFARDSRPNAYGISELTGLWYWWMDAYARRMSELDRLRRNSVAKDTTLALVRHNRQYLIL